MGPFPEGLLYGLLFVFALGPSFFALLQTTLRLGFLRGVMISLGVITTDAFFITLILLGFSRYLEIPEVRYWLGLAGALVLIGMGVASWLTQARALAQDDRDVAPKKWYYYYFRGLVINGFNPLIIVFWIGIVGVSASLGHALPDQVAFFTGFLTTVFLLDLFKCLLFLRIRHLISTKFIQNINRGVGVVFILFGLRILAYIWLNI